MSLINRVFSGSLIGSISFGISIVQNIFIVPIILNNWAKETYGLWLTCYFFINLMRSIDAGHQIYIGNLFSSIQFQDKYIAKKVLGSSIRVALFIGLFELLIYLLIIFFKIDYLIFGEFLSFETKLGIFSMLLMWFVVGSVGGILVRIIVPLGFFNRSAFWGIINKLIELSILIIAVSFKWTVGKSLNFLAFSLLIYSLFIFFDVKNIAKEYFPWWKYGSIKDGLTNLRKSINLTANNFLEQFSTNGLIIVISNILSVSSIPVFSTLRTVSNTFLQINQIILNPLNPDIIRYHNSNEKNKIAHVINSNWFFLNVCLYIPIVLILPNLEYLFKIWTNSALIFDSLFSNFLILSIIIISYGKVIISYLANINHSRALIVSNVIRFIILIPLSILTLKISNSITYLGICICISEVFASIATPFYFLKKEIEDDFKTINWKIPLMMFLLIFTFITLLNYVKVGILLQTLFIVIFSVLIFFNTKLLPDQLRNKIPFNIKKY